MFTINKRILHSKANKLKSEQDEKQLKSNNKFPSLCLKLLIFTSQ